MKLLNTVNVPNQFVAQGINHLAVYQNGVVSLIQKDKTNSKLYAASQTYALVGVRSMRISPSGEYIAAQTASKTVRMRNGVQESFDNNIGSFSIADTGQIVMIALASGAVQVIDSSVTNLTVSVTDDDRVVCAKGRYMVYNRARTITAQYSDLVLTPVASAKEIVYVTHDHNGKFAVFYSDNTFSYDGAAAKTFNGPAQGFRDAGDQILCTDLKKDWALNHFKPLAYPDTFRNFSWKAPATVNPDFPNMLLMAPGSGFTTADFDLKNGLAVASSTGMSSVSDSPYGAAGKSFSFDGTTSIMQTADSANIQLGANDFTIELFSKPTAGGPSHLIQKGGDVTITFASFQITMDASYNYTFSATTTGSSFNVQSLIGQGAVNTWSHIAISRKGNNWRVFFNGVLKSKIVQSGALPAASGRGLQMGHIRSGNYTTGTPTSLFKGLINGFQILNYAKYLHDFYPETQPIVTT